MFSNKDIADYYDQTEVHYRKFWKLDKHFSIHYGIWEKGVRNFGQALENTNRIMAERSGIESSHRVLDAGCGIGGPALFLAHNIGCHVTGISLSQKQIERAKKISKTNSLDNLLEFEVKDYLNTGYPSNLFDVVWALESMGATPLKAAFLEEAYRVMKPGGILIIADYFKTHGRSVADQPLLNTWLKLWAISELESTDSFSLLLDKSGYQDQRVYDYTQEIVPTARRMYLSSVLGTTSSLLYNLFHKTSRFARHHYKSGFLQYRALRKGLWEYKVITAKKHEMTVSR
jgi:tocopherol O-methyltransferase